MLLLVESICIKTNASQVVVLMGSASDASHAEAIKSHCAKLGVACHLRVTSAHKGTEETLAIVAQVCVCGGGSVYPVCGKWKYGKEGWGS